jgi:hypothetical protein
MRRVSARPIVLVLNRSRAETAPRMRRKTATTSGSLTKPSIAAIRSDISILSESAGQGAPCSAPRLPAALPRWDYSRSKCLRNDFVVASET